jgi:LacI family transcriptional regulator, galactose operon repressor
VTRVTLIDVAQHCQVSRATVSLVLRDSPLVADATRERVKQGMKELGYVYNRAAASLRTHRSGAIGVVLTQINNPYFAEFAAGLQDVLGESGVVPLLGVSNEDRDQQAKIIRSLVERGVDGIVMIPAHGTAVDDLPNLLGTPLVLMARQVPGATADYVGAVNHAGAAAAAEHLYQHGCRRIAFLGGFTDSSARQERAGGVRHFLATKGLDLPSELSPECSPLRPDAYRGALALLQTQQVDGVICFNDVVAFGLLDALADLNRRVGSEIRVIGFDDVHEAGHNRPSLSSVAVPARETGRRAAQIVLERAKGLDTPPLHEKLPTRLEARETCGCPRPALTT